MKRIGFLGTPAALGLLPASRLVGGHAGPVQKGRLLLGSYLCGLGHCDLFVGAIKTGRREWRGFGLGVLKSLGVRGLDVLRKVGRLVGDRRLRWNSK